MRKLTTEEFISQATNIHGDIYDYSSAIYVNNRTKIDIVCKEHGHFHQVPAAHRIGQGCPQCAKFKTCALTTQDFIERATQIHGNTYDYSRIQYTHSRTKVCIVCPIHGEFLQAPREHLDGCGCPKCGRARQYKTLFLTRDAFIEKSIKIHGNKYDYSKVEYSDVKTKVQILCPKHGYFLQQPCSHLNGSGCRRCRNSRGEVAIRKFLMRNNINFLPEKSFDDLRGDGNRKLQFDFYIPERNTLIEFDGIQHFKPIKYFGGIKKLQYVQNCDTLKEEYANSRGMLLFRISYLQLKNIDEILKEKLLCAE